MLKGHTGRITCLGLLQDGRIVSGSRDKTIRIWDVEKDDCRILQANQEIASLAILSDFRLLSFSEATANEIILATLGLEFKF